MDTAIAISDPRPLLTRALEFGFKNNLLTKQKVESIIEEGAKLTVAVASKYYDLLKEQSLKSAMILANNCISLALEDRSNGDLAKAVSVLQNTGLGKIFQQGYTLIHHLNQLPASATFLNKDYAPRNSMTEFIKDLCESADEKKWDGYARYLARQEEAKKAEEEYQIFQMIMATAKIKLGIDFLQANPGAELMTVLRTMILWSAYRQKGRKIELTVKELRGLLNWLADQNTSHQLVFQRIQKFRDSFPVQTHSMLDKSINSLDYFDSLGLLFDKTLPKANRVNGFINSLTDDSDNDAKIIILVNKMDLASYILRHYKEDQNE